MDDFDMAADLVKNIHDAENNDSTELAARLRVYLAEVNERIVADGYAPVEA